MQKLIFSQVAIKEPVAASLSTKLVRECPSLNQLTDRNRVNLEWVPEHIEINKRVFGSGKVQVTPLKHWSVYYTGHSEYATPNVLPINLRGTERGS